MTKAQTAATDKLREFAMKYRVVAISIALACLAGCGGRSMPDSKLEAYNRWYRLRADMLCGVVAEHLRR